MKLVGFLVFVVCDVILRLILNRSFFRELVSGWKVFLALAYCSIMGCVYREVMGGEGVFGFSQESPHPVEAWTVIILCGVMVFFHIWAFTSKLDD